jgi:hypothetical protein
VKDADFGLLISSLRIFAVFESLDNRIESQEALPLADNGKGAYVAIINSNIELKSYGPISPV